MSYDAAGRLATILTYHPTNTVRHYDGDGREVKRERSVYVEDPEATQPPYGDWEDEDDEYFIRSAVFGGAAVSEAGPTGKKKQTHVYAAGARIATQSEHEYESTIYETVMFHHTDASGLSGRATNASGIAYTPGGSYEGAPIEADPMGGNMGIETPYVEEPPEPPSPAPDFPAFEVNEADPVYVNGQQVSTTTVDGMRVSYAVGQAMLLSGWAVQCPNNDCGPRPVTYNGVRTWAYFTATQDGYAGFIPINARYIGNGAIQHIGQSAGRIREFDTNLSALNQTGNENDLLNTGNSDSLLSIGQRTQQPTPIGEKPGTGGVQIKCPPVPNSPATADIDANIEEATKHGPSSVLNPMKAINDAQAMIWFRNQVRNGGPWDYKQVNKVRGQRSPYEDFGNFNYGATGIATGLFNEYDLLALAGAAQIDAGTSKPEWGSQPTPLNPFGTPPYGDDPRDHAQIKLGIAYFRAKANGCK